MRKEDIYYGSKRYDQKIVDEKYLKMKQKAREAYAKKPTFATGKFMDMWAITKEDSQLFEWGEDIDFLPIIDKKGYSH